MIVAVPIVAAEITAYWTKWVPAQPSRSMARTLDAITAQFQDGALRMSVWAPAVVLILALSHSTHWPETFLEGSFPVKIARKYADEMAASRIYTSVKWVGYLIYADYP